MSKRQLEPLAIVGASAIFPGDGETESFWRDIVLGRDFIREVPRGHWLVEDYFDSDPSKPDKVYAKRGSFLSSIQFDAMGFGLPPQILPETDTAQLLALVAAKRVLDQVERGGSHKIDRSRVSVILGVTAAQKLAVDMNARIQRPVWAKAMRAAGLPEDQIQGICDRISSHYVPWRENTFPGLLGNVVAGRIANRLNLGGTNCVTDAACASSFAALSMAAQELRLGHCDVALTGGVDTFNDPFMYMCFSKTPALSPTGDCRPFSDSADGTILGEGVGLFALKRLSDAERDGDDVYAVVRGVGTSSDGRAKSVYAPLPEGQARAIRKAYDEAGFEPSSVELVEAHGTGTVAGDLAELQGLCLAYTGPRKQWCALGSVKSQIGHTKAAAGAAGLFKATMALHHKILPPTIKVDRPHGKFDFKETPFYLNTKARPWVHGYAHPRRAGVSSFGFGGSNFHLALEEHVGPRAARVRGLSSELVLFSAADADGLVKACESALAAPDGALRALAQKSQKEFVSRERVRLAVVARSDAELRESLGFAIERIRREPGSDFSLPIGVEYGAAERDPGPVGFIFPGQGSQSLEMGAELAMNWDLARSVWDFAAGLEFEPDGGRNLPSVVFPVPAFTNAEREEQKALLTSTEWAQPAIGAASLALLRLIEPLGIKPVALAGHSFGELTALYAAGVFDTRAFLKAARRRGELMAEAAKSARAPGSMLAVAAPAAELEALLKGAKSSVVIANRNSPRETVLAGAVEDLKAVESLLRDKGLTAQRLGVATAFHSSFVASACPEFERFLSSLDLSKPKLSVFSGTTAEPFPAKPAQICRQLGEQIKSEVRFEDTVRAMHDQGVRTFVEVGPGSVLTRLIGDILHDRSHQAVALDSRGREAATSLWRGLAKLAVAGVALDFSKLWMEYSAQAMPAGKQAVSVAISGAHYGKPEPTPVQAQSKKEDTAMREQTETERGLRANDAVMTAEVVSETPPMAAATHSYSRSEGVLDAFAEIHRSTAEAHAAYQRTMADSHAAFLRASEETLSRLATYLTGGTMPMVSESLPAPRQGPAPRAFARPAPSPASFAAPMPPKPQFQFQSSARSPAPSPARPPTQAAAPQPSRNVAAPAPAATPAQDIDLKKVLFEIVAEKTGYPAEMLKGEMELESDLGIDSIKRVEILSTLKKRAPQMQSATPQETAGLRTLAQIVDFMEKKKTRAAPARALSLGSSPTAL